MKTHQNSPTQSDAAWKRALERWFQPFLECFWPDKAEQIDWHQPIEELSQEMQSFTTRSLVGKQVVDKLYQVYTKSNLSYIVLIHVEVQGDTEADFSKRLFEYCYKIYDRYQLPVLPLVVLSDDNKGWHPEPFEMNVLGHRTLRYDFLSVKLLDWTGQETRLLDSHNPFENLVAIYLEARKTRHAPKKRLVAKLSLYKQLLKQGWGRDDVLSFATFLDGVMRLPETLVLQYHNDVRIVEEEMNVNYLTDAEYLGHQAGLKQGIQQGMSRMNRDNAKKMLKKGADYAFIEAVTGLSAEEIDAIQ